MKSMAWQATPTPVLVLLPSLLTTKTNRPHDGLRRTITMHMIRKSQLSAEKGKELSFAKQFYALAA